MTNPASHTHDDHEHTHDHDHEHTHDGHQHDHDHDGHHHDHDDHDHSHDDHEHEHDHQHGLLAGIASALHVPGFSHDHGTLEANFTDNAVAIQTVKWAFVILAVTTLLQVVVYLASGSVALLGDTVHNLGDALNSIPLLIAFMLARRPANKRYTYGYGRAEDVAGLLIVVSIAFSAFYILSESIQKLQHPQPPQALGWLALAAIIGFIGNEAVALLQIRVGRRIQSAAMIADGLHARTDGWTSLGVLVAAGGTALGFPILDPLIGIVMGILILFIAWNAARSMWYRLMDAVDPKLTEQVETKLHDYSAIERVDGIHLRYVGHQLRAELQVALAPTLTVAEAAAITDHVRHDLFHLLPALSDVTIGLAPSNVPFQSGHHH
jgi:cation diffusion facilitator family transporter